MCIITEQPRLLHYVVLNYIIYHVIIVLLVLLVTTFHISSKYVTWKSKLVINLSLMVFAKYLRAFRNTLRHTHIHINNKTFWWNNSKLTWHCVVMVKRRTHSINASSTLRHSATVKSLGKFLIPSSIIWTSESRKVKGYTKRHIVLMTVVLQLLTYLLISAQ